MATEPFWNVPRAVLAMGVLLLVAIAALAVWRYRSVVKLNRSLSRTVAELEQTEETLRRRNLEVELLNQAGRAFTGTLDPDQVLVTFLEETRRVLNVVGASVWLIDSESGDLICRQAVGPQGVAVQGWRLTPGKGIADWVTRNNEVLIVPDAALEERYYSQVADTGGFELHSILCVPLRVKHNVIGALEVVDAGVGRFGPTDGALVESLASTAAIAIENAQLYVQAQRDAQTKTVLLNEVNHRVKNNLATIVGLLYAEQRHAELKHGADYQSVMRDLIHRVQGLAEVHSMLSASQWAPLLLSDLLLQIVRSAVQGVPRDTHVSVEVTPSPTRVTADQAHHLALVINELATNAAKYGGDTDGHVRICARVWQEDGKVALEFRDYGAGYADDVLSLLRHNVGFALVKNIVVKSLRGDLSLHNDQGAVATIRFGAEVSEANASSGSWLASVPGPTAY